MALFGFAINFTNGATEYAIVSATTETGAMDDAILHCLNSDAKVETIVPYDAAAIVEEMYDGCAILNNTLGGN